MSECVCWERERGVLAGVGCGIVGVGVGESGGWSALEMGVVVCFVSDGGSRSFPRDREGPLCPSFSAERSTFVFYLSE